MEIIIRYGETPTSSHLLEHPVPAEVITDLTVIESDNGLWRACGPIGDYMIVYQQRMSDGTERTKSIKKTMTDEVRGIAIGAFQSGAKGIYPVSEVITIGEINEVHG